MCNQQSLRSACPYAQSDQSLCLSLEYSLSVKLLTEHHLEFLCFKGSCTGSSESTLVKMPHCWKSHDTAHIFLEIITCDSSIYTMDHPSLYVVLWKIPFVWKGLRCMLPTFISSFFQTKNSSPVTIQKGVYIFFEKENSKFTKLWVEIPRITFCHEYFVQPGPEFIQFHLCSTPKTLRVNC